MQITAHAKVNLTLTITGRDTDGYHQLTSAVCFTSFGDRMSITPANSAAQTTLTGPFANALIAAGGDSLVAAAHHIAKAIDPDIPSYDVTIDKQIPLGGGLGGGSANAAAYLRTITSQWDEAKQSQLRPQLIQLGADVPACFANHLHIMSDKGQTAHMISADDINRPMMVIANPHCHADTGAVFSAYAKSGKPPATNNQRQLAQLMQEGAWAELLKIGNDLTAPACTLYPEIARLLDKMAQIGHKMPHAYIGSAMSGSGASCFALLQDDDAASDFVWQLRTDDFWAQKTAFF